MLTPPVRTVYVVSENQLNNIKLKQVNEEIEQVKVQQEELETAYTRRKQGLANTLADLESRVLALEPSKEKNGTSD